jgi:hypothetical protein
VVSKEEVAVGRKGSGGAWGSTSRNAGLAGPQPRKMFEYEHWRKIKHNIRSLGCGLQFGGAENGLLAIRLQSSNTLFGVVRTSNSRCLVVLCSLRMRCACHFILNKAVPEQRPRAALKPQEPRSSGSWTPGAPTPVRRRGPTRSSLLASRESRVASRVASGKWQAAGAGATSVVGKAVLTLYPPLGPQHSARLHCNPQAILLASS